MFKETFESINRFAKTKCLPEVKSSSEILPCMLLGPKSYTKERKTLKKSCKISIVLLSAGAQVLVAGAAGQPL